MSGDRKADKWRARATARPDGVRRFLEVYRDERLQPYSPADSAVMAALERCLGCGNCLAVCPVVGALAAHDYPGPRTVATSLSRSLPEFWASADVAGLCTTCLACEEACPGDVPVWRAVLTMRVKNFEQNALEGRQPLTATKQLVVDFFTQNKLAAAARLGAALQGLAFRKTADGGMKARVPLPLGPLGSRVLPALARRPLTAEFPEAAEGDVPDGPRVAVFAGCLYNYAYTDTGRSLVGVLRRHAREVVVPAGQVCCGAPAFYSGDLPSTRRLALENARVFNASGADFVVTACASCGDVLTREYSALFLTPAGATPAPEVAAAAAEIGAFAARVRDVHVFLASEVPFRAPGQAGPSRAEGEVGPRRAGAGRMVTVHDPCHLARGQGISAEVRRLLGSIPGVTLREMAEPGVCCGGAGSYSLDHWEVASAIREAKVEHIAETGAEVVVTGCPSCRMHISDGLERAGKGRPVLHLVDLLEAAYAARGD